MPPPRRFNSNRGPPPKNKTGTKKFDGKQERSGPVKRGPINKAKALQYTGSGSAIHFIHQKKSRDELPLEEQIKKLKRKTEYLIDRKNKPNTQDRTRTKLRKKTREIFREIAHLEKRLHHPDPEEEKAHQEKLLKKLQVQREIKKKRRDVTLDPFFIVSDQEEDKNAQNQDEIEKTPHISHSSEESVSQQTSDNESVSQQNLDDEESESQQSSDEE